MRIDGTVRGKIKEFTIEAGKGRNPGKFISVAGPFKEQLNYQHITRLILQDVMRGSEWILRIRATDDQGHGAYRFDPGHPAEIGPGKLE